MFILRRTGDWIKRALAGLSLRGRVVALVLVAALPGIVLAEYVAQETRAHSVALLQEKALRLARKAALEQEAMVEATRQLLATMAALPSVRSGNDCGPMLQAVLANPGYNWVAILDAQGRSICGSPGGQTDTDQPWFDRVAGTEGFAVGGYEVDPTTGRAVTIASLTAAPADAATRVFAISIDIGWLSDRLASADVPGATITVLDRTGMVLARNPDHGRWIGRTAAGVEAVERALREGDGTGVGDGLDGGERAFGFAPLATTGAIVVAAMPTDTASAEADRVYYRNLTWLCLLTAGLLAVVTLATDRLVLRPLARLSSAARALSRGNLHVRAGLPHGRDEIGQLAAGFDGMAAAVERMVLERTEALRDSEERFRLAIRFAPIIVFSQDLDLRYTWAHGRNLHAPAEAWLGRSDADMFAPADAERLNRMKHRVLESGQGAREAIGLALPEGRQEYDIMVEPLRDESGQVVGLLGAAIDQTAERRRQTDLDAARAEAEQANLAKTRFLAAASHDLRQPLQAMNLYLHLLNAKLITDEQRMLAQHLRQSAEAATALLDTLMALSALETGQLHPEVQPIEVAPLLRRIAVENEAEAHAKGLTIAVRATPAVIDTDPVLLERMVRNLVKNAIRYTDSGRILMAARPDGRDCRIEVWDTGRGIPEEKLQVIFHDFYQVPGQRPPGERGLGLGLSTVARMGRLLGHETGVRSRLGYGSVFFIRVPRGRGRLAA